MEALIVAILIAIMAIGPLGAGTVALWIVVPGFFCFIWQWAV